MSAGKRVYGSVVTFVGYMLSPLSWWNDLFVNIPLAYLFACVVNFIVPGYFLADMIIGYWLTNIAGFIMMHIGVKIASLKEVKIEFLKYLVLSLCYTFLVVALYYIGWVRFPTDYHF